MQDIHTIALEMAKALKIQEIPTKANEKQWAERAYELASVLRATGLARDARRGGNNATAKS